MPQLRPALARLDGDHVGQFPPTHPTVYNEPPRSCDAALFAQASNAPGAYSHCYSRFIDRLHGMKKIEFQNQAALIAWANARSKLQPELRYLYHIPNGGSRNFREAANLKRAGVRAGVLDLHLPIARGAFIGLWIEMKAPDGRSSPEQRDWQAFLHAQGHRVEICRDWLTAKAAIEDYLSEPAPTFRADRGEGGSGSTLSTRPVARVGD